MNVFEGLVWNFHHSSCKLESRNWFLNMVRFRPYVSYHYCFAVSSNGIFQKISEFRLPIWNMRSLLIS